MLAGPRKRVTGLNGGGNCFLSPYPQWKPVARRVRKNCRKELWSFTFHRYNGWVVWEMFPRGRGTVSDCEGRMGRPDWTGMGGVQEKFLTTHWSMLEELKGAEGATRRALMELLLERYWKPVYCYLRRRGHANEPAKDLTQGFFHEVVLNRGLFERANPSRGSFRSLLLHALRQYLADQQRRESAGKRIPPERLVHLEALDSVELPQFVAQLEPDESFNYTWKADLLERVLTQVRTDYMNQGMKTHWLIFRDRLLGPLLQDHEVPSMRELCTRYGLDKQAAVSHMLTTVKRHFQTVLRSHVRRTVLDGQSVEGELQDILRFLRT